jgi:hypothetical protein
MARNTHIMPFERVKNDFFDVYKAMFQGIKRPCEKNLLQSGHRKKPFLRNRLSDVLSK